MSLPRHSLAWLVLTVVPFCLAPLTVSADQSGGRPLRADGFGLSTAEEETDAREIADRINEALNLRKEVVVTLRNDVSVAVSGRVTARRYWLIVAGRDGSEFLFRAGYIASVSIR
ncbi:MAG TPA: hypothetical protein VG734_14200 [Lacunisphaera sp.]|nr:hypothetical protein [Lacunisphaera sp.]